MKLSACDGEMARLSPSTTTLGGVRTFPLACLEGAAGLLLSNQFFLTPAAGSGLILKAYIAFTIGGWGSLAGEVICSLLIATFEVFLS